MFDTEDDAYWLKFYNIQAILDINKILYQNKKEQIVLTAKIDAEFDINE